MQILGRKQSKNIEAAHTLEAALALLLKKVDDMKGNMDLDKIFETIGQTLAANEMNSAISIIDKKSTNLVIKHISVAASFKSLTLLLNNLPKRIRLDEIPEYKHVLEKRNPVFIADRLADISRYFPGIKQMVSSEVNSIVCPLLLKGTIVGFFEISSSQLSLKNIKSAQYFSKKLMANLTNLMLFKEVQESEMRYRHLFERAREGFMVLNGRLRRYVDVNQKLCQLSGYSRKEFLQMNYLSLFDLSERRRIEKYVQLRISGKSGTLSAPVNYETKILTKQGDIRHVELDIIHFVNDEEWFVIIKDISEKKKMAEALIQSEKKFRILAENSSDVIWVMDPFKLRLTYISPSVERMRGYTPEEMLKMPLSENLSKSSYHKALKLLNEELQKEKSLNSDPNRVRMLELAENCKNGKQVIVEAKVKFLRDKNNKIIGIFGVSRDITERKRVENALKKKADLEKAIAYLSTYFINLPPEAIGNGINLGLQAVGEFADVDRSYIFLFGTNKKDVSETYKWIKSGINSDISVSNKVLDSGLINMAEKMAEQDIVQIPSVDDLPESMSVEKRHWKKQGIKSLIAVPMVSQGQTIGFIGFDTIETEKVWTEEIISLLKIVSEMFVNAIERKKADEALRASESRFRNLLEQAQLIAVILDVNGKITFCNDFLLQLTNWAKDEVVGKNWFDSFVPLDSRIEVENVFRGQITEGNIPAYYENDILTKEGERKKIFWNNTVLRNQQNKIIGTASLGVDFTERKKVDAALRASEEKYRNLISNANDGVIIIDTKGYVSFSNLAFQQLSGYTEEELKKIHISKFIHPDDYDVVVKRFNERIKGGNVVTAYEFKAVDKAGNVRYVSYNGSQIFEGGQVVGIQAIIRDVSENKQLLAKIEQARKHYEQVIDTIKDSICVIGKNQKIMSCNRTFASKVDMQAEQIQGKPFREIISLFENKLFKNHCGNPDCQLDKLTVTAFESGKVVNFVDESKDENGSLHYHNISIYPAFDSKGKVYQIVYSIRDITERKTAEENLRRLSEFNKRVLDNIPVSIMTLGKDGNILSINDHVYKISDQKQFVGKYIWDMKFFVREKLVDKYKLLLEKGVPFTQTKCRSHFSVDTTYVDIVAVPLKNRDGKVEGAISMAIDNTEAIIAKEKLMKLNEDLEKKIIQRTWQLNQANKDLANAIDLKSKFISDASHELRTPLTIIQGNLDLAKNSGQVDLKELHDIMEKEIQRMSGVLRDLTILTNADSQKEALKCEDVNIELLVIETIRSLEILAKQKNITIKHGQLPVDLVIKGDESKLEKLLINIVNNAIKYSNENGHIDINVEKGMSEVRIAVTDNGIGIPKQDLPYIFERFYRVDKSRSRKEGGTGLGLSICKWIAESHGGYISVSSEENIGSVFTMHLPYNFKEILAK